MSFLTTSSDNTPLELDSFPEKNYIGKDSFMTFFRSHYVLTGLPMYSVDRQEMHKTYHEYCTVQSLQEAKDLHIVQHLKKSGVLSMRYHSGGPKMRYVGVSWKEGLGNNVKPNPRGKKRTVTLQEYQELVRIKTKKKEKKEKKEKPERPEPEPDFVDTPGDPSGGFYASVVIQPVRTLLDGFFPKVVIPSWDEEEQGEKGMERTEEKRYEKDREQERNEEKTSTKLSGEIKMEKVNEDEVTMVRLEEDEIHVLGQETMEVDQEEDVERERMMEGAENDGERTVDIKNVEENVSCNRMEVKEKTEEKEWKEDAREAVMAEVLCTSCDTENKKDMEEKGMKCAWNVCTINLNDNYMEDLMSDARNVQKITPPPPPPPPPRETSQKGSDNTVSMMKVTTFIEDKEQDIVRNMQRTSQEDKEEKDDIENTPKTTTGIENTNTRDNTPPTPTTSLPTKHNETSITNANTEPNTNSYTKPTNTTTTTATTPAAAARTNDTTTLDSDPYEKTPELIETIRKIENKYGYPAVYKLADTIAEKGAAAISMKRKTKTKTRTKRDVLLERIKFTVSYLNLWKAFQFYLLPLLPMVETKPIRQAREAMKEYLKHMEEDKYRFALVLWEMLRNVEEGRREHILAAFFLKLVRSKYMMERRMNWNVKEEEGEEQRGEEKGEEMDEEGLSDSNTEEELLTEEEEADDDGGDNEEEEEEEEENEDEAEDEEEKCEDEPMDEDLDDESESVDGENDNDENDTDDSEKIPTTDTMAILVTTTTTTNTLPATTTTIIPTTTTNPTTTTDTTTTTTTRPKLGNETINNTENPSTSNTFFSSDPTFDPEAPYYDDYEDNEYMSSLSCSSCYTSSSFSDFDEENLQQCILDDVDSGVTAKSKDEKNKEDRLTDEFRLVMKAAEYYRSYTGRLLNLELCREFPSLVKTVLGERVVTSYLRDHLLESISLQEWAEFCKDPDFMDCLKLLSRG